MVCLHEDTMISQASVSQVASQLLADNIVSDFYSFFLSMKKEDELSILLSSKHLQQILNKWQKGSNPLGHLCITLTHYIVDRVHLIKADDSLEKVTPLLSFTFANAAKMEPDFSTVLRFFNSSVSFYRSISHSMPSSTLRKSFACLVQSFAQLVSRQPNPVELEITSPLIEQALKLMSPDSIWLLLSSNRSAEFERVILFLGDTLIAFSGNLPLHQPKDINNLRSAVLLVYYQYKLPYAKSLDMMTRHLAAVSRTHPEAAAQLCRGAFAALNLCSSPTLSSAAKEGYTKNQMGPSSPEDIGRLILLIMEISSVAQALTLEKEFIYQCWLYANNETESFLGRQDSNEAACACTILAASSQLELHILQGKRACSGKCHEIVHSLCASIERMCVSEGGICAETQPALTEILLRTPSVILIAMFGLDDKVAADNGQPGNSIGHITRGLVALQVAGSLSDPSVSGRVANAMAKSFMAVCKTIFQALSDTDVQVSDQLGSLWVVSFGTLSAVLQALSVCYFRCPSVWRCGLSSSLAAIVGAICSCVSKAHALFSSYMRQNNDNYDTAEHRGSMRDFSVRVCELLLVANDKNFVTDPSPSNLTDLAAALMMLATAVAQNFSVNPATSSSMMAGESAVGCVILGLSLRLCATWPLDRKAASYLKVSVQLSKQVKGFASALISSILQMKSTTSLIANNMNERITACFPATWKDVIEAAEQQTAHATAAELLPCLVGVTESLCRSSLGGTVASAIHAEAVAQTSSAGPTFTFIFPPLTSPPAALSPACNLVHAFVKAAWSEFAMAVCGSEGKSCPEAERFAHVQSAHYRYHRIEAMRSSSLLLRAQSEQVGVQVSLGPVIESEEKALHHLITSLCCPIPATDANLAMNAVVEFRVGILAILLTSEHAADSNEMIRSMNPDATNQQQQRISSAVVALGKLCGVIPNGAGSSSSWCNSWVHFLIADINVLYYLLEITGRTDDIESVATYVQVLATKVAVMNSENSLTVDNAVAGEWMTMAEEVKIRSKIQSVWLNLGRDIEDDGLRYQKTFRESSLPVLCFLQAAAAALRGNVKSESISGFDIIVDNAVESCAHVAVSRRACQSMRCWLCLLACKAWMCGYCDPRKAFVWVWRAVSFIRLGSSGASKDSHSSGRTGDMETALPRVEAAIIIAELYEITGNIESTYTYLAEALSIAKSVECLASGELHLQQLVDIHSVRIWHRTRSPRLQQTLENMTSTAVIAVAAPHVRAAVQALQAQVVSCSAEVSLECGKKDVREVLQPTTAKQSSTKSVSKQQHQRKDVPTTSSYSNTSALAYRYLASYGWTHRAYQTPINGAMRQCLAGMTGLPAADAAHQSSGYTLLSGVCRARNAAQNSNGKLDQVAHTLQAIEHSVHFDVLRDVRRTACIETLCQASSSSDSVTTSMHSFVLLASSCGTSLECLVDKPVAEYSTDNSIESLAACLAVTSSTIRAACSLRGGNEDKDALCKLRDIMATVSLGSCSAREEVFCSLALSPDKKSLLLGRYASSSVESPLVVNILLGDRLSAFLASWRRTMDESKALLEQTMDTVTVNAWDEADKKRWWKQRLECDTNVESHLQVFQELLGPWRCLLMTRRRRRDLGLDDSDLIQMFRHISEGNKDTATRVRRVLFAGADENDPAVDALSASLQEMNVKTTGRSKGRTRATKTKAASPSAAAARDAQSVGNLEVSDSDLKGLWPWLRLLCACSSVNALSQSSNSVADDDGDSSSIVRVAEEPQHRERPNDSNNFLLSKKELLEGLTQLFRPLQETSLGHADRLERAREWSASMLTAINTFKSAPSLAPSPAQHVNTAHGAERMSRSQLEQMKVEDLRKLLHSLGQSAQGRKADLVERIMTTATSPQVELGVLEKQQVSTTISAIASDTSDALLPREHFYLILDEELQSFSVESIPILRSASSSRVPSFALLLAMLKQHKRRAQTAHAVDACKGWCVVDPDGNLPATRTTMKTFLDPYTHRWRWTAFVGEQPSAAQFKELHAAKDIFVYCGHGAGAKLCGGLKLRKLDCPTAWLWGCSSGRLERYGVHDPYGPALSYLIGGASHVLGNLWDVTDKDIDRFSIACMQDILGPIDTVLHEDACTRIPDAVSTSRDVCKLKYAVGGAPVMYGLPVSIITKTA